MAGRRFNKRNPGTGKFAKGGVVINGRKKRGLSKKARRLKNQAKHYSARTKNRTAHSLNRPKTVKAILGAASAATAAYITYESFKDTQLGAQLDTEIRSRLNFSRRKINTNIAQNDIRQHRTPTVSPESSKANGSPLIGQRVSANQTIAEQAKKQAKLRRRKRANPGEQMELF